MPSIAGTIERIFTGRDLGQDFTNLENSYINQYRSGQRLTDEGLADMRRISGDFRDLIRRGGLTDALAREYDVQQGRISDDVVRAGRSFRATLQQQAAASGGQLSPAAMAAMAKEAEVETNEAAFNARNELSFERARVAQENTARLQQQILDIADAIRTTGMTREEMAQAGRLAIQGLRFERNRAIDNSARGWASMFGMGR